MTSQPPDTGKAKSWTDASEFEPLANESGGRDGSPRGSNPNS